MKEKFTEDVNIKKLYNAWEVTGAESNSRYRGIWEVIKGVPHVLALLLYFALNICIWLPLDSFGTRWTFGLFCYMP